MVGDFRIVDGRAVRPRNNNSILRKIGDYVDLSRIRLR